MIATSCGSRDRWRMRCACPGSVGRRFTVFCLFATICRWPGQMPPARVPCGAAVCQMSVSAALAGPYAADSHGQGCHAAGGCCV